MLACSRNALRRFTVILVSYSPKTKLCDRSDVADFFA